MPGIIWQAWAGLMQADVYAGFNRLYEASRKGGPIDEAACWASARRKFFDLARSARRQIASEDCAHRCAVCHRARDRRRHSASACASNAAGRSPSDWGSGRPSSAAGCPRTAIWAKPSTTASRLGRADPSSDDGRLCMTNNAAERGLRAVAIGRRNWTFAGSDEGGRRAAAIDTLIATAKLNDVTKYAALPPDIPRQNECGAVLASCPTAFRLNNT
jgi:transposase